MLCIVFMVDHGDHGCWGCIERLSAGVRRLSLQAMITLVRALELILATTCQIDANYEFCQVLIIRSHLSKLQINVLAIISNSIFLHIAR